MKHALDVIITDLDIDIQNILNGPDFIVQPQGQEITTSRLGVSNSSQQIIPHTPLNQQVMTGRNIADTSTSTSASGSASSSGVQRSLTFPYSPSEELDFSTIIRRGRSHPI